MSKLKTMFALLALALLCGGALGENASAAQGGEDLTSTLSSTSTLIVQVRRTNGNSVGPNAFVTVSGPVIFLSRQTNAAGRAKYQNIPAGFYTVSAVNIYTGRKASSTVYVGPGTRKWVHLRLK